MKSSDSLTLAAQEERKQVSCICSGEQVTDLSACDPAPACCPHLQARHWKWSTASTAAGACRAGRWEGTWLTQLPHTGPLISTEMLQWVLQLAMPGKCQPYPASPMHLGGSREPWQIHALFLQFCIINLSWLASKGAGILCWDRKKKMETATGSPDETILTCH